MFTRPSDMTTNAGFRQDLEDADFETERPDYSHRSVFRTDRQMDYDEEDDAVEEQYGGHDREDHDYGGAMRSYREDEDEEEEESEGEYDRDDTEYDDGTTPSRMYRGIFTEATPIYGGGAQSSEASRMWRARFGDE